ncbi:MAG: CRISPR-associated helicase Cas3', partial [Tissierellia bacterium]|nr:CRISPR-associated helicase Cas3' [Tissierellia bacterium]
ELACLYHDLGKANQKFQEKIKGKKVKGEIPHGLLSIGFLNIKELVKKYGREKVKILTNAIAYHHERNFPFSDYREEVRNEIELMKNDILDFKYDKIPELKIHKLPSLRYINGNRVTEEDGEEVFNQYIVIKGLLNRIDYASSAHENVEWENNFLEKKMEIWKRQNKIYDWNDLQKYMKKNRNENVIAVAQTGMGKTEAGFLWIGNSKGFFTLPLRTAINSIYDRVRNNIIKENLEERLGLLHSDAFSEYIKREDNKDDYEKLQLEEIGISEYHERTKQLTMPLTICTIDQLFDFVYRYRGFEHKLATLAYSKLVIDEIQMYSADLIAYLVYGLSHITKLGGKFAILTATFPPFIGDLLKAEGVEFKNPEPFIDEDRNKIRHSIKIIDEEINSDFILSNYNRNKVLVICNTVKKAQELYEEIKIKVPELKNEVNLFHSSFIKEHRAKKEKEILSLGDKNNKSGYGIYICTQVAEASLDIDFDILITELSDLNGLFQRMGRCYRSRSFNKEGHNCYIFNGGDKKCSGVGYVIDEKIFELSKKSLQEKKIDGKISEEEKINLINELYTTEKLEKTNYYKEINNTLAYIKGLYTNAMDKTKAKQMFRNINSVTVIPEDVFNRNKEKIERWKEIINENRKTEMSKDELEDLKKRKAKARHNIMNYTVSIPYYLINSKNTKIYEINKYERIQRFMCKYDEELGVIPIKDLVYEDELSSWDNFF